MILLLVLENKCAACWREAVFHVVWSEDYDKWFCEKHSPTIWQLVDRFLTPEQKRFKKWLQEQMQ